MLEIAKSPLARRLWQIAKQLHIPVSEAANLSLEELDFYEFSMLVDDPKRLELYENTFRDPEYDEWERAFDEEMQRKMNEQGLMREREAEELSELGYDVSVPVDDDDEWERV